MNGPVASEPTVMARELRVGLVGAVIMAVIVILGVALWSAVSGGDSDEAGPATIDAAYVPIDPCRLFDLREDGVGDRTAPLGPGEVYTQQVVGKVGNCVIPTDATSVALNVTIVRPTKKSYLTIYPADLDDVPTTSNLNWLAGQAPTPNSAYVKLGPDGDLKFFNADGLVYVVVDVVGYRTAADPEALVGDLTRRAIPSGVTVTGNIVYSVTLVTTDQVTGRYGVDLPGVAPVALDDEDVAFSEGWGDADGACDGTADDPTAPRGMVCIYPKTWENVVTSEAAAAPGPLPTRGFTIDIVGEGEVGSVAELSGSWAYTAP